MIELHDVDAGYRGRPVLHGVCLDFRPGQVLALVGPNGSGKSTLLRAALGLIPCTGGTVLYDGVPLDRLTPRQVALQAAFLSQNRTAPRITARRMVLHGRFPHLGFPRRYRREDFRLVEQALTAADAVDLADRPVNELSGGQRQKIYLAMAIAQQTPTILMDEPTTFLDIAHQLGVMELARRLADEGKAVVLVLHDLPLALSSADRLAVLQNGRLVRTGTPEEIYQSGVLEPVFGVRQERAAAPDGWRYFCRLPRKEER
ncbi:MAG: ABC transporter ATP-binding protein [Gemmiger sp.]|uniref:ABC transporter ATP-binding protein n=1 Tax=Gemmiger sp. TaxID=2049027 RepID=UPI002E7698B0|nr:ABC transporter ATP-binding protein [Gemmiger sp.]MEE0799872.1 ABC transporter ATP-binding protein [Gemmiger sp.]